MTNIMREDRLVPLLLKLGRQRLDLRAPFFRPAKTGHGLLADGKLARGHGCRRHDLRALIREYLFVSLFRACAESLASENAGRLAAMQRADKNINELLEHLNGTFHRLRQSGIDEELFDVISGFEALSAKKN